MKKSTYEKIEFSYGFIVVKNGKRVGLFADEDAADEFIASKRKR